MAGFAAAVRNWSEQTETDATDALRKICLDLFGGVLLRTRVDTGRLRGSWRMNIGEADTSVVEIDEDVDAPPQGAGPTGTELNRAMPTVAAIALGDVIVISNSLPYAEVWNDEDNIVQDTVDDVLEQLAEALTEVRRG